MGATHMSRLAEHMLEQGDKKYSVVALSSAFTTKEGRHVSGVDVQAPEREFALRDRKTRMHVAQFRAQTMPGCCGAVIFYYFSGKPEQARKLVDKGLAAAKAAGFGLVLSTLRADNSFEPGVFAQAFTNGKTGNELKLFTVVLEQRRRVEKRDDVVDGNEG